MGWVHDVFGKMASSESSGKESHGRGEDLDGLTHDAFSVLVSSKNNEGMEAQIEFLVGNGFSASELKIRIQDMIREDLAV